jgi:hypothetical protein
MKGWLKEKARIIFVNLAVLTVGLLCLELFFGNWIRPDRLNSLNLVRNVELSYDVGGLYPPDGGRVRYTRDRFGLRGNYGDPAGIDLLTVGGSTTDQRFITDGATWQDVLQREFLARGKPVRVANAGVDGQTTYGHVKDFDWWFPNVPNMKAKYVLFYVGINDLSNGGNNEYDDLYERPSSAWAVFKEKVRERSALYYLYRTLKGIGRARAERMDHKKVDFLKLEWTDEPRVKNHEGLMSEFLQSYGDRLRALDYRVRSFGAAPIYVTQQNRKCKYENNRLIGVAEASEFNGREINGVDSCDMMRLVNVKTMEFCRATGGVCVDLAGELEFEDQDFYDFYHNTPRGAEKIGRYLYGKLSALF